VVDALIATTALDARVALATANVRHYRVIAGLSLVDLPAWTVNLTAEARQALRCRRDTDKKLVHGRTHGCYHDHRA
jgi:hypothetical protein